MKKKSHGAVTDPQQSLIISISELYLPSKENQEQTLGTPSLATELTVPVPPCPLPSAVLKTEPQLPLKAHFHPKCSPEVREQERVNLWL